MKLFLFILSFIFLLSGAVNLGSFGIFPAIPFFVLLVFLIVKNRSQYLVAGIIALVIVGGVYSIRINKRDLFLNSIGKEVVTIVDLCLTKYRGHGAEEFVLAMEMKNEKDCDSSNMGDAIKWEVLPKNSKLKIEDANVSHADMGEHYTIVSSVSLGKISLLYPHYVSFDGKTPLSADDLRYGPVYSLSLLMYWPMAPFLIFSLF